MSFQAYMDSIEAKTGRSPDDFRALAAEKGLDSYKELVAWLKGDFALGQGHANAMAHVILGSFESTDTDRLDRNFAGAKASWRPAFDALEKQVRRFGADVALSPTDTYVSFVRSGRKFALVQVSGKRLDIGIKLKGTAAEGRFAAAGSWNSMVTHRVRIEDPAQLDDELLAWLRRAYEAA